jgi:hypothetical protein
VLPTLQQTWSSQLQESDGYSTINPASPGLISTNHFISIDGCAQLSQMVSTAVNFDLNNGVLAEKIIMVQGASK